MSTTITRNSCGRTNHKILFSKNLGEIENFYRDGRINQSEFELYTHIWNKTKNRSCNCVFDNIENGNSGVIWNWLNEIGETDCFDFFCSLGWPEGYNYCMRNFSYYELTGFSCLQIALKNILEQVVNNRFYS